jgi:hypothetical protein
MKPSIPQRRSLRPRTAALQGGRPEESNLGATIPPPGGDCFVACGSSQETRWFANPVKCRVVPLTQLRVSPRNDRPPAGGRLGVRLANPTQPSPPNGGRGKGEGGCSRTAVGFIQRGRPPAGVELAMTAFVGWFLSRLHRQTAFARERTAKTVRPRIKRSKVSDQFSM